MKTAGIEHRRKDERNLLASRSVRLGTLLRLFACAVWPIASALGADSAVPLPRPVSCRVAALRNGFTVRYARQEAAGPATRLWVCDDASVGYVEIPTEQIKEFQPDDTAYSELIPSAPPTPLSSKLPSTDRIESLISEASARYRIDPDFVSSVVKVESGFNPLALSPRGARGLMQIMPRTAVSLGVQNPFDPAANVEGGTKYLRQLLDQYHGDALKTLAAYNAGPGRVEQFGGVPPYRETRAYVARIIQDYNRKKIQQQAEAAALRGTDQ